MFSFALLCAFAAARSDAVLSPFIENGYKNSFKSLGGAVVPSGCLYEGAWYRNGASVSTGEACLHCACGGGALTCRRRACAPLPEPPPSRCHVLHRRGSCCPELHCPDGVRLMEHGASARFENDDSDVTAPASFTHACVEGGTVYAAGSAMRSSVACEQCFCLGGARRCVRPKCLPPPSGCKPRPAPGACCPQRYYCEHRTTKPPEERHPHDCKVEGKWVVEGERVLSSKSNTNCTQCFCLRGAVQCQPMSCAPPLLGCKPLLRPGECCAHQYVCDRHPQASSESRILTLSSVVHTSARKNNLTPTSTNTDTTTKTTLASVYNLKNTSTTATKNHLISTTKVKRKTNDPPPASPNDIAPNTTSTTTVTISTTKEPTTVTKLITTTEVPSTTELTTEMTSTEQPEGTVRIIINGTINCTAELSSTSLPLNISLNDTDKIKMEAIPRVPLIDVSNLDDHTFSANDIITDRTVNGDFDENESFVINVTSSLMTNTSKPTTKPPAPTVTKISLPVDIAGALNGSKKTKGDYDFDYTQPTLPPSLPNLKIIPFVAADAVVEDEQSKESLTYPILEREDKFPVYYPTADSKNTAYATRREDTYHSTQYPVFITDKVDHEYPSMAQDIDLTSSGYSNVQPELGTSINEYTVSASLGNHITESKKVVTQQPPTSTTFKMETPAVNLFSPPVETEGGFIPKGPGLIDEYYAVFPSTPSAPSVPHLTTSMQLDVAKGECLSSDGRRIPEGDTVTLSCSECTCAWGDLHCSPRPCHTPAGCRRRPASSGTGDLCCGDLICDEDNKTTPAPDSAKVQQNNTNESAITNVPATSKTHNESTIIQNTSEVKVNMPVTKPNKTKTTVESGNNVTPKNKYVEVNNITTTTEKMTTPPPFTSPTISVPENHNHSLEYEDEEEDDGFSFGSVLKLLLSDNYETTTVPPKKSPTTKIVPPQTSTIKRITTTKRPRPALAPAAPKPSIAPFVPLPPYIPPKISHNPINRIDHLVLGESTAIKKTTYKPVSTTFQPVTTVRPTTRVTKPIEFTKEDRYTTQESPQPPGLPGLSGVGPGLLKLAGCNIYGRMYRVGRIITELSTPCQECWCTEFGVQCKQLKC